VPLDQSGNQVPFPPVPAVIKLSMKFTTSQNLDIVVNTHWQYSGTAPGPTGLNAFLTTVATAFTNSMQAAVPTNVTHVQDTATDLTSTAAGQAVQTHTQVGSRTGGVLPISTAALFNGKIARRYRGGKPRNYWPFGTDTDLADSAHWTSTAQGAFNTAMAGFNTALAGSAAGPASITTNVNVSYYEGHFAVQNGVTKRWRNVPTLGPSPAYPHVDAFTSYTCNIVLGSQRRRLRPG
jgi:hypothetical protein